LCVVIVALSVVIGFAIPSTTLGDKDETLQGWINPLESLTERPTKEEIKQALVFISQEYGLDETQLLTTIQCESGFSYDPDGHNDGGLAYGVAQFHKPTFKQYCQGDYYSAKDQLRCLAEMWVDGEQGHWSCYNNHFK
jgi:hypothetical protein